MNILKIKWSKFLIYKGGGKYLSGIALCLLMASYLGAKTPLFIRAMAHTYGVSDEFYRSLWQLLGLFVGIYGNRVFFQIFLNKYITHLIQFVRGDVYKVWLLNYDAHTGESQTFEKYPLGEVIARIMSDSQAIRELLTSGALTILMDLFFITALLISFLQLNLPMGLFIGGIEIISCILLIWGSKYMRVVFQKVRIAKGKVGQSVANIVGGVGETFYSRHGQYATTSSRVAFDQFLGKQLHANVWDASYYSLAESLYPLLLALVAFIAPYAGVVEGALVFAIIDIIQRSSNPIKGVAGKVANLQRAVTGFERMEDFTQDLLNSASSTLEKKGPGLEFLQLDITIRSFHYQKSSFSLKNIAIEGKKGELIGLVGLSGSGKSTLLNIIAGNILPADGEILFTGAGPVEKQVLRFPGKDGDIQYYREQIGLISQDSHIFTESLMFNITMEQAETPEFLAFWEWPCGEIDYLKSWGIAPQDRISPQHLSLGQAQLIAAIRACYLRRPVILFDEVSSGLDSALELALRKVILLMQKDSLTMIVAHRVETVMKADRIFVLDNGKVSAMGNHFDLLKKSKIYRQFIDELREGT